MGVLCHFRQSLKVSFSFKVNIVYRRGNGLILNKSNKCKTCRIRACVLNVNIRHKSFKNNSDLMRVWIFLNLNEKYVIVMSWVFLFTEWQKIQNLQRDNYKPITVHYVRYWTTVQGVLTSLNYINSVWSKEEAFGFLFYSCSIVKEFLV